MKGPYEHRVALDEVVQMMSGLAYMTGPPGHPLRAGASIIDIMGGTIGALGILVSLRERERTGRGGLIENGLFETAAFIMGQHMAYAAITQERVPPMPARVSAWAVYELFETQDGRQIFIGITSDKHWKRFCQTFERPDLLADQTLATNNARIDARERLIPELQDLFVHLSLEEIIKRSEEAGIPFSPIARPEDLSDDPQLNQGDSLTRVMLSRGELAKLPRLPLALDGHRFDLSDPPPGIGAHTQQTLNELGYLDDEIAALREAEVIVTSP